MKIVLPLILFAAAAAAELVCTETNANVYYAGWCNDNCFKEREAFCPKNLCDCQEESTGCDMVFLQNPNFGNGLGMNVHIRTSIQSGWSFVEAAVVQIGDHTLEVMGGVGSYWINGGESKELQTREVSLGDFPVHFQRKNDHQTSARLDLGNGDAISIETFKEYVQVNIQNKNDNAFQGSAGLLGSTGKMVARDGVTVFEDINAFGQEWKVRPTDVMLFHGADPSGVPRKCPQHTMAQEGRGLEERIGFSEEHARLACAEVHEGEDSDICTFSVLATRDELLHTLILCTCSGDSSKGLTEPFTVVLHDQSPNP